VPNPTTDETSDKDGETPSKVNTTADEQDDDSDDGEERFDAERAKALIAKLRAEAKTGKQTARELEAAKKKLREREEAELSETERLRLEVEALKKDRERVVQERQVMRDEQAIFAAAVKHQAVKPQLIVRLIDIGALEHDEDGKPVNAESLVKELLKDEPYLKGEPGTQGVPGTPRASGQPGHEDRVKENREKLQSTGLYGRF
jgi:hypothetical protein